jgi:hypothetical protein
MQDRDLYAQILGVREPWRVERVELKLADGEVHVHLAHEDGLKWACPECGERAHFTITSQNAAGVIWTPVNIERFCTLSRHGATVRNTVRVR